jgi:hypothetical protein
LTARIGGHGGQMNASAVSETDAASVGKRLPNASLCQAEVVSEGCHRRVGGLDLNHDRFARFKQLRLAVPVVQRELTGVTLLPNHGSEQAQVDRLMVRGVALEQVGEA